MELVILDSYTANPGDLSWEGLSALGPLRMYDRTEPEQVLERIGTADIVLVNKTGLDRQAILTAPNLRYVGVMATGYNVVDLAACRERGITVTNVPGYSTDSVAELCFALLLELCFRPGAHDAAVRAGQWGSSPDFCFWLGPIRELAGKTFGILGFGSIGRAVAEIAKAFRMEVLVCSRRPETVQAAGYKAVDLDQLLERAHVLSLHCPLTEENRGLLNEEKLARMKPGAILLNTARGALVDAAAVRAALEQGRLGGYGADVLTQEPPVAGDPLIGAPNCVLTPHLAWASREARERLISVVTENVRAFIEHRPQNVVY